MRRSLLPRACVALLPLCLAVFGCTGGINLTSGASPVSSSPTVTGAPTVTPVSQPSSPSNSSTAPAAGPQTSLTVVVSDPAACRAPGGPFSHVYVTITDIQGSPNADANPGDGSFVDLTPGLSAAPQQVDLMGQPTGKCFLAALATNQSVNAGEYQQLRVFLAPDAAASKVANNACGGLYANCIVRTDNSLYDLALPAASERGVVIYPGQLANASLTLNASEQPAIDVSFDVCSSILVRPDGSYEFNPQVRAGLVATSGGSISGSVVSAATGQALKGGQVVVALEQKDPSTGIDRVLMRTTANADGSFMLCPVPQGTYDLVAVGIDGANISYSAGVETGIQSGQVAGQIPLVPGAAEGTLNGTITTQNATRPPIGVAVAVRADALQQLPNGGPTITVPLLPSQNPYNAASLTAAVSSCPAGWDCSQFAMQLPSTTPNVVACSEQTAQFQQQGGPPGYVAESFAQVAGAGGTPDCQTNRVDVTVSAQGRTLQLNPNQSTTAANMTYTACE